MPQLNPAPWFSIMVTCWLILFMVLMPKLLHMYPTNQPTPPHHMNLKTCWTWPWQ